MFNIGFFISNIIWLFKNSNILLIFYDTRFRDGHNILFKCLPLWNGKNIVDLMLLDMISGIFVIYLKKCYMLVHVVYMFRGIIFHIKYLVKLWFLNKFLIYIMSYDFYDKDNNQNMIKYFPKLFKNTIIMFLEPKFALTMIWLLRLLVQ